MSGKAYHKLAKVLDTLPNGFPSTESGVEIKLLKKIFSPEDIDLFCDLRLSFESPEQIAQRTGRPLEGLNEKLIAMWKKGQIMSIDFGDVQVFKMVPWAFGIFEFQLPHLDKEFAELNEEFAPIYGEQFFKQTPQMMQTLPIETEISTNQESLPYEHVSSIIDTSESFMLMECICKKEEGLLDNPCSKPTEVCMAFAPVPNIFDNAPSGRVITRDEAKAVLNKAEEAGLVHLTSNFQNGRFFICNCCGCCCGVLKGINKIGLPASTVINSHYYAEINPESCTVCGTCADERCQVNAIEEGEDAYVVIAEKCIGCGLCITTCPGEAIQLVRKNEEDLVAPPNDEAEWFKERGRRRGVDFSKYA